MTTRPLAPELLWELLQGAPVGFALVTAPGVISWANRAYFETTGRNRDLVGDDFHHISETDGTWSPAIRAAIDSALGARAEASFRSVRARHRSRAQSVYLDIDIRALGPAENEPRRVLIMVRDVSERVLEHEQTALFYESFRSSTNAMQLTDAQGIMVDVNPAYEKIYGDRKSVV